MTHDPRLIEAVADAWIDLRLRCERGEDLSSEDVAEELLDAIDAATDEQGNRIAWVAPWEPPAQFVDALRKDGGQRVIWDVVRDACLKERWSG